MTYQFNVHQKMKFSTQLSDVRASLSKAVGPDLNHLTSLLEQWVEQTLEKWKSTDAATRIGNYQRMFYRDSIAEAMFRLSRVQVEGEFIVELVIASIRIERRLRSKGYFSQLLTKMEAIVETINGDLIVECANPKLSAILMHRGYLKWSEEHRCFEQFSLDAYGSWKWPGKTTPYVHSKVIVPAEIAADIKNLSVWHGRLVKPIIDQAIAEAFEKIGTRLREEVVPNANGMPDWLRNRSRQNLAR